MIFRILNRVFEKKLLWIVVLVGIRALYSDAVIAQSDLLINQYSKLQTYYNPAVFRGDKLASLTAAYNHQAIGFPGSSSSFILAGSFPVALSQPYLTAGVLLSGESIGLFKETYAAGQLSCKFPLFKGLLSVGLEGAFVNSSFDGRKIHLTDGNGNSTDDPAIPQSLVSGKTFDFSTGIYYLRRNFWLGISVKHILNPEIILGEKYKKHVLRSYSLMAGYTIKPKSSLIYWTPSFLAMYGNGFYRVDTNLEISIREKYFAGVMLRPLEATGFNLGLNIGMFRLGYAFEMPINDMRQKTYGSHELVLSYNFNILKHKPVYAKHKSVRLL